MSHEGVMEALEGVSPFDMLFSVFGVSEEVKKFREKFTEFFANTPLADNIARTSFAKSLRLGVTILSAAIGGASPQTMETAKYLDAAKQVRTLMYEAGIKQAEMMQDALSRPSPEQHQVALARAAHILDTVRANAKHEPGSPEQYAFEVVIANVVDPRTSQVLKDMLASDIERDTVERWLRQRDVKSDFSALPKSPVMQDDVLRTRFIDTMHELYDTPEIRELQALIGDSRLLYNYECIFRAINQPEYRKTHDTRIRRASEELLKEGNLEQVIVALKGSKTVIPAEKIATLVAQYVPDSQFAHIYGERVPLTPESDEGLARLQS